MRCSAQSKKIQKCKTNAHSRRSGVKEAGSEGRGGEGEGGPISKDIFARNMTKPDYLR